MTELTDEEMFYVGMDVTHGGGDYADIMEVIKAAAQAQISKLKKLGYKSPEEVEEMVKKVRLKIYEELKAYAELLLAFIDKEKNCKDQDAFIITVKDMIRSMIVMESPEALKGE